MNYTSSLRLASQLALVIFTLCVTATLALAAAFIILSLSVTCVRAQTIVPETPSVSPKPLNCAAETKVSYLRTTFLGDENFAAAAVKAPSTCTWTVKSTVPWVKFHRTEFHGYSVFSFQLETNDQAERTGDIVIGGQTISLTQLKRPKPSTTTAPTATGTASASSANGVADAYRGSQYYPPPPGNTATNLTSTTTEQAQAKGNSSGNSPGMAMPMMPYMGAPQSAQTNPNATATTEQGLVKIDEQAKTVTITAMNGQLYQLRKSGTVLRYTSEGTWEVLDNNVKTRALVGVKNELYQWRKDEGVLRWEEKTKQWLPLGADITATALVGTEEQLYTLRPDGIWKYTSGGWVRVGAALVAQTIVATKKNFYQLRSTGQGIWEYDEATGEWKQIEKYTAVKALAVASGDLYQWRADNSAWRYVNASWQHVQGGIPIKTVVVIEETTYVLDEKGQVWMSTNG